MARQKNGQAPAGCPNWILNLIEIISVLKLHNKLYSERNIDSLKTMLFFDLQINKGGHLARLFRCNKYSTNKKPDQVSWSAVCKCFVNGDLGAPLLPRLD